MSHNEKFDEEEVDKDLTSYLKKPVQKKKRTYQQVHEEETESEENEDDIKPCTKKTKDEIYSVWNQAWEEKGAELLPLVQKLSTMSESEAKAYLACLKAVHSRVAHKHITDKVLQITSQILCHPNDALTPLAMQEDEFLKSGTSLLVAEFLGFLGKLGFFALLAGYAGTSRYLHRTTVSKTIVDKTGAATETVQDDGVCEGRDGENHIDDKVND